jgi:hypothetical protein
MAFDRSTYSSAAIYGKALTTVTALRVPVHLPQVLAVVERMERETGFEPARSGLGTRMNVVCDQFMRQWCSSGSIAKTENDHRRSGGRLLRGHTEQLVDELRLTSRVAVG